MKKLIYLFSLLILIFCSTAEAGFLKADTGVTVTVGPFLDVDSGVTPETGVTLGGSDEAELLKCCGAATVDISGNEWEAIAGADGWYHLGLTAANLDTEGTITLVFQDDSLYLPVFVDFTVIAANPYDSLFAAATTDYLQVDIKQQGGNDATSGVSPYPESGITVAVVSPTVNANITQVGGDAIQDNNDGRLEVNVEEIGDSAARIAYIDNLNSGVTPYPESGVTVAKLADNVITTASINDGAITDADVANDVQVDVLTIETADATDTIRDSVVDDATRIDGSSVNAVEAKVDTIDNFVDDLEGRLTATRAAYLDNLNSGVTPYPEAGVTVYSVNTNAITSSSIATDAIGADELATSGVSEILSLTLTQPEPGAPPAQPTLEQAMIYPYVAWRNKDITTTSGVTVYKDDGTTPIYSMDHSESGTTYTANEWGAPP